MLAISTAWNAHRHTDARSMIDEIKALGINHVELNFKLSKKMVDDVQELVRRGYVEVISLHNFCPVPDSIDIQRASPDYYSLASPDEKERRRAVLETKRTIDTARSLKAHVVILHSGRLKIKDRTRELARTIEKGIDSAELRDAIQRERSSEVKKGYIEALFKSIGELARYANDRDIKIGLENRFYIRELPSLEEFEIIFATFPEKTGVYYWHDTGHAQVFENIGIARHRQYLERFSSRLLGVHLHDIKNVIDDHRAPLAGDFDFTLLKPYLRPETLKVIEPHYPATAKEIEKGIRYLTSLFDTTT